MKQCPKCRSIVDDNDICPICKTSLIYEPSAHTDEEQIVFSRYYAVYLLKTLWFSVLCFLLCVIRVIGWHAELGAFCMPILLFSVLSFVLGATRRRAPTFTGAFYTKEGYRFLMVLFQYLSAGMAVFLAMMPLWL